MNKNCTVISIAGTGNSSKYWLYLRKKGICIENPIKLTEKYERNGWPSLKRPGLKPPQGWNLSLLNSLERIRTHALSPDGATIAYIKDGESLSDVFLLALKGSWPTRITTDRPLAPYWDDEIPFGHPTANGSPLA